LGALKEINSATKQKLLNRRGITGGQIFTGGTTEDLTMILKRMSENKPGWMTAVWQSWKP
jgi:hypothetical protein